MKPSCEENDAADCAVHKYEYCEGMQSDWFPLDSDVGAFSFNVRGITVSNVSCENATILKQEMHRISTQNWDDFQASNYFSHICPIIRECSDNNLKQVTII